MNKALVLAILIFSVGIMGCVQQPAQPTCHEEKYYTTVNEWHCQYNTGCNCVKWSITQDCEACQCEHTRTVCT